MDKQTLNGIDIFTNPTFSSDFPKQEKNDRINFKDFLINLVTLVRHCIDRKIVFCKLSFIMYFKSGSIIKTRVSGSAHEIRIMMKSKETW